jgi:fatty acid desaturase
VLRIINPALGYLMAKSKNRGSGTRTISSIEWPTVGLLGLCYAIWAGAAFLVYPAFPAFALAILAVAAALHSSLQHEVLHGHPTRNARVNEALVSLPIAIWFPYRRFRAMHLRHHCDERLTDPYDDPESFYRAAFEYERLPKPFRMLLRFNNTLAGRLIIGPALMVFGFMASDLRKIREGNRSILTAWALHLAGVAAVALILNAAGIPLWLYLATSAYCGLSLIAIRTFAEHQWSEKPDGRTIIVEKSLLSILFLNNNLHLVHHKYPGLAWYELPALYRARQAEWKSRNGGYFFRSYLDLFKAYVVRPKEPVAHPVLRLELEPGRHFHPASLSNGPAGGLEAVPAKPTKA